MYNGAKKVKTATGTVTSATPIVVEPLVPEDETWEILGYTLTCRTGFVTGKVWDLDGELIFTANEPVSSPDGHAVTGDGTKKLKIELTTTEDAEDAVLNIFYSIH